MDVDIPSSKQADALINTSIRSSGLTCLVCGSSATGFNFSVITCMCCKAFFRRNALYGLHSYQCRYSTGECTINMLTRRDCSYCRLKKCFQVGMKKELILTDDVKRLKREKILANRKLTISSDLDLYTCKNFLSGDDSILLRNISNVYEERCRLPIMSYEKREYELICQQPLKSRIKSQHYLESFRKHQFSLNDFFQHLPDLQEFSLDERKMLLSHNTRFLMRLNSVETLDDSFPLWGAARLLIEIMYGKSIMDDIDQCLHQVRYYLNDSRCTQLMLIILLFSTSINYQGNLNTLDLYKLQEKYLHLLWSYLKRRYGSMGACEKFSLIIRYCLRLQAISHLMEVKIQGVQWRDVLLSTQRINID